MKKIVLLLLISIIIIPLYASPVVLTLETLESSMRMNNSELIELQQYLLQGELDVKQAKASRFGSLDASIGFQYMANPPIGPISTNTDTIFSQLTLPPGFSPGGNQSITLYEGMENTIFDSSLTYSFPLFTWGKINASVDLYNSLKEVKEAQLLVKNRELSSEIKSLISTYYHLDKIISLLKEEKQIANKLLSIARNSLDIGLITPLDFKEKQSELLSIDEGLIEVQFQKDEAITRLERISGLSYSGQHIMYEHIKVNEIVSYARTSLEELIQMGHMRTMPMISGLMNAEKASSALYNISKGNLYGKPDFALQVSLGFSGPRIPFVETDWREQDDYIFNVSIGMKSNLFDGRKAVTEAKKAQSEILIQKAKTLDGKHSIAAEIKKYRNEILSYSQLYSILNQKISILEDKTFILEKESELGFTDEVTLLTHRIIFLQELIKIEQILLKIEVAYFSLLNITLNN